MASRRGHRDAERRPRCWVCGGLVHDNDAVIVYVCEHGHHETVVHQGPCDAVFLAQSIRDAS